jgi:hypothetical protein
VKLRPAIGVLGWAIALGVAASSCSGSRIADPTSRFFAVHNVMLAIGLYQTGPVNQGTLAAGQEVKVPLSLPSTCVAVVAMGGAGASDLSLQLLDPDGNVVAEKAGHESELVVRTCVDRPGSYMAVLRMVRGSGEYLLSSWTGGDGAPDGGAPLASGGTCDAPTALLPGHTYAGTTEDAPDEQEGTCASSGGHERVYRLDLPSRQRVTLELNADFDAALYVRKGACSDEDAEVRCNDDEEPGQKERSRIDLALDAGTYFVFVDGSGEASGNYRLLATVRDAPTLADVCRGARPLVASARATGNLTDALDNVNASCGRDAKGVDAPYRFEVPLRARVRFTEQSTDFRPVVHVRRACEDASSEVGCSDSGFADDEATWSGVLDPGAYWVFADGADDASPGSFSLGAEMVAQAGNGSIATVPGDGCGDAVALSGSSNRVVGDTFAAKDDVSISCAANGGADVVYRIDLPHRSRVTARLVGDESSHALALERTCADKATEMGCGSIIDRTLEAGAYFLVVDGARPESLGRFALSYKIRDLAQVEATCAKVPVLSFGRTEHGSTVGAGDRFASCGGRAAGQGSPDRVYRFSVSKRTNVKVTLEPQGFRAVLSLRRVCSDDATEVKCVESSDDSGKAQIHSVLEPGTYFAVVDGAGTRAEGTFTLRVEGTR